ncbi:hypothetical protein HUJ04_005436 [Dendroctonus ponderosae]|nr:hypothetical protein HUJ04_005436 [Dendroctonus ponderosae]
MTPDDEQGSGEDSDDDESPNSNINHIPTIIEPESLYGENVILRARSSLTGRFSHRYTKKAIRGRRSDHFEGLQIKSENYAPTHLKQRSEPSTTIWSLSISDALFESRWYEQTQKVKKIIIIIMMRSRKPLRIMIGPFYPLTIHTALNWYYIYC